MSDEIPSSEIARVKNEFADREAVNVSISDGSNEHLFLMTSPKREEWKKYRREVTESGNDIEKIEAAIERAALAQIRYPSRDDVKALFDRRPGIIQLFADELAKLAGAQSEVVSKKL